MKNKNNLILFFIVIYLTTVIIDGFSKEVSEFYDPARDSESYISLAESIKNFNKFSRVEYSSDAIETIRTPVYPLILSTSLSNLKIIILVQNLLHILSSIVLYKVSRNIAKERTRFFLFLAFLFNPILVSLNQLFITESFSIFLISMSIYFIKERSNYFMFYIIIGILPLLRPAFLILSLGVLVFVKQFERDITFKKFVVAIIILVTPSLLWTIRNYQQTDLIIFSSLSGMNLLEETASGVMAIHEDIEKNEPYLNIINIEYEERRYWSQILRNEVDLGDTSRVIANAPGTSPHLVASEYQNYAIDIIKENKIELSILIFRSFIYLLLEPGDHLVEYVFGYSRLTVYKYIYSIINFIIVLVSFKNIINSVFQKKQLDNLVIYYSLLILPLLLLSTPHARFGSILIFFHYYFFMSKDKKLN